MDEIGNLGRELKQTRPFPSREAEALVGILRTADVLKRTLETLYEPYGITAQQYNVLRILRGARPEALATMEIAERMIERAPGITRLLDRLEAKGLVSRERSASDRRCVLCSVTPKGLALVDELDEPVSRLDAGALEALSAAEQEELIRLLDLIRQGQPED